MAEINAESTANPENTPAPEIQGAETKNTTYNAVAAMAAAEQAEKYKDLGFLYAGTGIIGDASLELGFSTGEGAQRQRSGIGLYLRSDHLAHRTSTNAPF